MSLTCTSEPVPAANKSTGERVQVEAPVKVLQEIVHRYGTPTYAYDIARIRAQVAKLQTHLPSAVEILYSLKANASLGLCGVLADCGLGADVVSAGELAIARAAGFSPNQIFLTGPDRSGAVLEHLRSFPEVVLSVDSVNELSLLAAKDIPQRVLLRLRPDFCSYATCSAGPDSRFGITMDDLPGCRDFLPRMKVIGFHVFSGSHILATEGMIHHMRSGVDQALRAADILNLSPQIIDLGGGFGIPYCPGEKELDLAALGEEFRALVKRAAPARLVLELGRYLVAQSGWYLTTVLARQTHRDRPAVVVDGGTHQRGDMCGLGLRQKGFPPAVLPLPSDASPQERRELMATDVLGCLSLPSDVMVEARLLPPLSPGEVLAFPNAGAYGLLSSPWLFHGHPAPAEVAFEETEIQPLRLRQPPEWVLQGQTRLK
jgi:diaminopimelate decarboxylase